MNSEKIALYFSWFASNSEMKRTQYEIGFIRIYILILACTIQSLRLVLTRELEFLEINKNF